MLEGINHKKMLLIFAGIAIVLVCLGYWIDSDTPYDSVWLTVFEFCMLTLILFGAQTVLYFFGYGISRLFKRLG